MRGEKCSNSIYLYFSTTKPFFFFKLHLDRVGPGARRVCSIFQRYWANRVKTREGMAGVHYEREHCEREYCITIASTRSLHSYVPTGRN